MFLEPYFRFAFFSLSELAVMEMAEAFFREFHLDEDGEAD